MKITDPSSPGNPSPHKGPIQAGLLTTQEAARYLGVSPRKVQAEVAAGRIRKVVLAHPGARRGPVRFRPIDLDDYVESCVVDPLPHEDAR